MHWRRMDVTGPLLMKKIFVFGSNLSGIHGAGAAKHALMHYGAVRGISRGRSGSSYAIPTKETPWKRLSLIKIKFFVDEFLRYAKDHPNLTFYLTPIGCGLAGYKPTQIAPMFKNSPPNVIKPKEFLC